VKIPMSGHRWKCVAREESRTAINHGGREQKIAGIGQYAEQKKKARGPDSVDFVEAVHVELAHKA